MLKCGKLLVLSTHQRVIRSPRKPFGLRSDSHAFTRGFADRFQMSYRYDLPHSFIVRCLRPTAILRSSPSTVPFPHDEPRRARLPPSLFHTAPRIGIPLLRKNVVSRKPTRRDTGGYACRRFDRRSFQSLLSRRNSFSGTRDLHAITKFQTLLRPSDCQGLPLIFGHFRISGTSVRKAGTPSPSPKARLLETSLRFNKLSSAL